MRELFKGFFGPAFMLIALFLVLSKSGGFARAISSSASSAGGVFKTLQGR